ncbi:MAG TPA: hypothetical protein VMU67_17760 [Steroidobacteraceae bacterium]|nr:hypothetical protein [Steroidobacteraceae bacterium]
MSEEIDNEATHAAELRRAVARVQTLLESLPDAGDENLAALRERVATGIASVRARLESIEAGGSRALETPTAVLERWSRANPWAALAIGAGVGLLVGLALGGRRSREHGADPP